MSNKAHLSFEQKVDLAIRTLRAPEDKIIVALSGGADSVALLMALSRLGHPLIAAHCNFHLRGTESDTDESFVSDLCDHLGIPLRTVHFDTIAYASAQSVSIEMAARHLRYEWFATLISEYAPSVVATAHHRDDDIETLLLNLSMGTGIRGLTGMPPKRADGIIRPLLRLSRSEIESYLSTIDQNYCTDSTNVDTTYKRNHIRHHLFPAFRVLNPSADEAITRTMQHLRGIECLLSDYITELKSRIITDRGLLIASIAASSSPETILYEVLRPYGFGRTVIQDISRNLKRPSGSVFYSTSHQLIIGQTHLEIRPVEEIGYTLPSIVIDHQQTHQIIDLPTHPAAISHQRLILERIPRSSVSVLKTSPHIALFDADLIQALTLRPRKEHDRIHPFGMNGSKTIARYAIDRKLSHTERASLYILCAQDQPVWIVGIAADRRFGIHSSTTHVLRCTILD